jgi:hypothetical protein
VDLLPSAGGRNRYDHSMGTHGRPLPLPCGWPPLAVQRCQQAEMSLLPGQVDISVGVPGGTGTWVCLAVAVHDRYVGMAPLRAMSAA